MSASLLTVGLFADPHYAWRVYGDRACQDSLDKVRACLQDFAEREVPLVVSLGDLADSAEETGTEAEFLSEMTQLLASYPGDCRLVLGNHEVADLSKAEALDLCGDLLPAPYYAFDHGAVRCLALDGNCHADGSDYCRGDFDWTEAWLGETQLHWLASELDRSDRSVVVFCHENLDDRLWEGARDPHVLGDAGAAREMILASGKVRAIFQGHYHAGLTTRIGNIPVLGLPAMVTGSETAYAVAEVLSDGQVRVTGCGRQECVLL